MGLSCEPPKAARVDCCRQVPLTSAAEHFHGEEGVQREDGILVAPQQLQNNLDHARKQQRLRDEACGREKEGRWGWSGQALTSLEQQNKKQKQKTVNGGAFSLTRVFFCKVGPQHQNIPFHFNAIF